MTEPEITLTLRWNIKNCRTRMMEIKKRIILLQQVVQVNFPLINEIIRGCEKSKELQATMAGRLSDATRLLRYIDTLTQKLTHIMVINQALMDVKIRRIKWDPSIEKEDSAEFIFRLNYCQARIANYEFLYVINTLQQISEELGSINQSARTTFVLRKPFKNLKKGCANFGFLLNALRSLHADRVEEKLHAVYVSSDIPQLFRLYSLNSERLVLQWLLTDPTDDVEGLLQEYAQNAFLIESSIFL